MIPILLLAAVAVVVDALAVPVQKPLGQSQSQSQSRRLNGRFLHITGMFRLIAVIYIRMDCGLANG